MMRLLHRYLLGQTLLATLAAVGVFVFVLVSGNALREVFGLVAEGRIDWDTCGYLLAVLIPTVLPYALPLGLLLAVLLVLGRMSAQGEITAMKAGGFSLEEAARPLLLLALLGTALSFSILAYYAPKAITEFRRTLANVVREDPLRFIQPRTFVTDFPGFVLYAESRQGSTMRDFRIWELDGQGRVINYIQARRGQITFDEQVDALRLQLAEGTAERRSSSDPEDLRANHPVGNFAELALRLPLDSILGDPARKIDYLTLNELQQRIAQTPADDLATLTALRMQWHKRFTFAVGVLALGMLAIPLGVRVGRAETHANLALAVGLAMVYFLLTIGVSWLERYPAWHPQYLLWLPNLIFMMSAAALFGRACRL